MTERTAGHTALPWYNGTEKYAASICADGQSIGAAWTASLFGRDLPANANAEFIVRAVNSHYEILGLLREWLGDRDMSSVHPDSLTGRTFAALKLSEASDD